MFSSHSYRLEKEKRLVHKATPGPEAPDLKGFDGSKANASDELKDSLIDEPALGAQIKIQDTQSFVESMVQGLSGEVGGSINNPNEVQPELQDFESLLPVGTGGLRNIPSEKKDGSQPNSVSIGQENQNDVPSVSENDRQAVSTSSERHVEDIDATTVHALLEEAQAAIAGLQSGAEGATEAAISIRNKLQETYGATDAYLKGEPYPNGIGQLISAEVALSAAIDAVGKEKSAPKTHGERLQQNFDAAMETLSNPDASATDKLTAAMQALGAMSEMFDRTMKGTMGEALPSDQNLEENENEEETESDTNTEKKSARRERLEKDIEERGYEEVMKSKEKAKERLSEMNKEVDELEDDAERLDNKIDADKDRIKDLEQEKANAPKEDKADIQEQIDTIEGRIKMNQKMIDAIEERRKELLSTIEDKNEDIENDITTMKEIKNNPEMTAETANKMLRKIAEGLPESEAFLKELLQSMTFKNEGKEIRIDKKSETSIEFLADRYGVALRDGWEATPQSVLTGIKQIIENKLNGSLGKQEETVVKKEKESNEVSLDTLNTKAKEYIANMVGDAPGVRSAIEVSDLGNGLVELRIDKGLIETRVGVSNAANLYQLLSQPLTSGEINQETNVMTVRVTAPQLLKNLDEIQERNIRNNRRGQIS